MQIHLWCLPAASCWIRRFLDLFFSTEGGIWINQPKFVRLYVCVKKEGGFGTAEGKVISHVQEIPHFVAHQTQSAGHLQSIPALRVSSRSSQTSLHPLQLAQGSTSSVETSLVHGLDSGQSTALLCHCLVLTVSEGQNNTEGETFVLSSYSLTSPRLSFSTKAGHTGLVSKGCSDVQG